MLEIDLIDYLKSLEDLTAIVEDRIFPSIVVPQTTAFPYLTMEVIGADYPDQLNKPCDFAEHTIQIDSWANTILQSNQIAEIVRLNLHGYQGGMGDTEVAYVSITEERNLNEGPQSDNDKWIFRRAIRYKIKHRIQIGTNDFPLPGNAYQWGADGQDGQDGKNAYELAVANGYSGSLSSWLSSLVGPPGDKGDKGDKGDTGSFSGTTSDSLPEGSTNLYYTSARAEAKQDKPIVALCSSDFYWTTSLIDQSWSYLTIPSTGIWAIKLVLLNMTTISQTIVPRLVMDGAAIAGATGTVVGTGGTNIIGSSIVTGSPTYIIMNGGGGIKNGRVFEFCLDFTTAGGIKLQLQHNNGDGDLRTCKGSYLEAKKLS